MSDRYVLTGGLLNKLRDTVRTVDGMTGGEEEPTRVTFSEAAYANRPVRIGTFGTAAWSINSSNTVTLTNVGVTGYTVLATNVFGTIQAMGSTAAGTTRPCAIAKDGTAWYLIQPVPSTGGAKAFTFTGGWSIDSDKSVTSMATGETINVTNILYTIPDAGVSMTGIAVQEGTAWQLANVRHRGTAVLTKVAVESASLVFYRADVQVVGGTASSTTFPLSTCDTYAGSTVAAAALTTGSGAASFSSTSFFLG